MWVKVPPPIKPLSIRLLQQGCGNRPFFHIVVAPTDDRCVSHGVEQLGVFDPMANERGERLLALNVDRFKYYMAGGAWLRSSLAMLLGTAGVVPIHPHAYTLAWKARQRQLEKEKNEEKQAAAASAS
ncbi:hypothetical protein JTE90_019050 [Oedothorax gibbosus]|uniref:Small ribosomal subunit protein bS16m n=1 Tax=Oedothorax gibbosus TaxID=931172 RepID=A0AAV6V0J4_9ARAC|nr:hypothetical protein JTE90_019050 [Oedothorax gibbosus]